jgi:hypothetical protein
MTTMSTKDNTNPEFQVGDHVTVDGSRWPGVWTVAKLNPKNIKLVQGTRRLNCSPLYMTKVDGDVAEAARATVTTVPIYDLLDPGQVVRLKGHEGLWVVLKHDGGDRCNLARLGGDHGRYMRAPRGAVTVVNFEAREVA